MKKKLLVFAVSILAVVLLVLGSLSNVGVGYQIVQNPISKYTTFMFGKTTSLQVMGNYISFQAVNIIVITIFPFSFHSYSSGEYFEIYKEHRGLIALEFIFALTNAFIPNIACVCDNNLNRLVIACADANVKWKNMAITTDTPLATWRVFSADGTPLDGWNSTMNADIDIIAGDYLLFQFNKTTPPTDVKITFYYIPTDKLTGIWTLNV